MSNVSLKIRFSRGWAITKTGWTFIKEHKITLLYPLLSFVISIGIIFFVGSLTGAIHIAHALLDAHHPFPAGLSIALSFLFYFSMIFASSLMHTALSTYINQVFDTGKGSFFGSLGYAISRFPTLVGWSVISALLAMIFNGLKNQKNKFPFNIILSVVGSVLSFAWGVLTFFVIPIIALDNIGTIASIEKSGQTMKKMWGESAGAIFSIGIIGFLLLVVCGGIIWGGAYLLRDLWIPQPISHTQGHIVYAASEAFYFTIKIIVIAFLPFIIITPITSVARTLFKTAAYRFTQGKSTGPFAQDFIKTSFTTTSHNQLP